MTRDEWDTLDTVGTTPPLRRFNGFGAVLYGHLPETGLAGLHWKLYFVSALWLPIIPLRAHLVTSEGNAYRSYKELGVFRFHARYRKKLLLFYLTVALEGLLWVAAVILILLALSSLRTWMRS